MTSYTCVMFVNGEIEAETDVMVIVTLTEAVVISSAQLDMKVVLRTWNACAETGNNSSSLVLVVLFFWNYTSHDVAIE